MSERMNDYDRVESIATIAIDFARATDRSAIYALDLVFDAAPSYRSMRDDIIQAIDRQMMRAQNG